MTEDLLKSLKALEFDSLTAREAVELRAALNEALARSDAWANGVARAFGLAAKPANPDRGRPPEVGYQTALSPPQPTVKPPTDSRKTPAAKRRGRPVPEQHVEFTKRVKPQPQPLAVGGADAAQPAGPQAARLFEQSYVSKNGPRPDVPFELPADHPRRSLPRESSVTPEVDMSDFSEVEEAFQRGQMGKIFQGNRR
jgi:hypothetical protein